MASLSELKARFSEITNLPAKKAYVILAAPSMEGCGMRSKADWEVVLEKIERVLVPIEQVIKIGFAQEKSEESSVEVEPTIEIEVEEPQPSVVEQELEPIDEEVVDIEESIAAGTDPERAFACGFSISQNPKQLYRRLARKYHPDANKGVDTGIFNVLSEVYKTHEQQNEEREFQVTSSVKEWGQVDDPEAYEELKDIF